MEKSMVKVRLPENLGVKACGEYRAGVEYEVDAKTAEFLLNVKRFERVSKQEKED